MFRKLFFIAALVLVVLIGSKVNSSGEKAQIQNNINQVTSVVKQKTFDKAKFSTTDSSSIWVIVNKKHQLSPKDYVPSDLVFPSVAARVPGDETMKMRSDAAKALESLFAGAKGAGLKLMISSAYRSYYNQLALYNSYVKSMGQAATDTQSARAGYSEHQTGLAVDVEPSTRKCEVDPCFADTPEGKWLAANAYKYGFIIRYPDGKEDTTGYIYEPWHIRYVGTDLSTEMKNESVTTLEDFFGVTGGKNY